MISYQIWGDNLQTEQVQRNIQSWLETIRQHLRWHQDSFRAFNESLKEAARQAIEQRRTKLLANQNLIAALGILLKRRSDAITTYTAPEVTRKIPPQMPPATVGSYKPEPILEEAPLCQRSCRPDRIKTSGGAGRRTWLGMDRRLRTTRWRDCCRRRVAR